VAEAFYPEPRKGSRRVLDLARTNPDRLKWLRKKSLDTVIPSEARNPKRGV
jgi:hypothetical protein